QKIQLEQALKQLAKEHDANLLFDPENLKDKSVKQSALKGSSIEQILKRILPPLNLSFKKLGQNNYVIKPAAQKPQKTNQSPSQQSSKIPAPTPVEEAATITVAGQVIDEATGEPLIGVNIKDNISNTGTASDFNGMYSIQVEERASLVVSYIGYVSQVIKVKGRELINIRLQEDIAQLDEVVVVGYGSQKRSDLTGSLSSVGSKELQQIPNTGLDQALQGRAAGVMVTQNSGAPGGAVSIRVRGIGSTTSAEPLYVIDGIPVVNDNQAGANNFAELDGGGQYSNALNTINPNDIESIEVLKDASATAIFGARGANGVVMITTKRGKEGKSNISFDQYFGVQEISKKIPVMNLQQYADYYNDIGWEGIEEFEDLSLLGEGTDWQDAVFRRANMQNYQLTLTGGSNKTNFAISGGYHHKEGIVVGSDFSRISGKINIDHKFSDRLKIGNSLLVSKTRENITFNDNSNGVIYTALLMVPNSPVRNADGSFAGPQEEITLSFDNPVARALETTDINSKVRVLSNLYAELELLKGLTYRTEFGTDIIYSNHNTFFPSFERGNFFGKSGVRRNWGNSLFWINKHYLTFNRTLADDHQITMMGGFEAQEGNYEFISASRENLPNNQLQQLSLGDAGQQQNNGGANHWALLSYFGRFNYIYKDKYLLTATYRIDGSSRFGEDRRYGTFPSAALAWRLSSEEVIKDIDQISNLKIRVGYGAVGNQEIGLYSYIDNLIDRPTVMGNNLYTGFAPNNIANPTVRWESSKQTNIGLDLGLFNNRLDLVVDYYVRKADGTLLPALLPSTAGSLNPPFVNIGEIENRGLEFTVRTQNTRGKFDWNTTFNISFNRNEVINLGSNGNLIGLVQRLSVTRTEEGQPIGQFYGYVTDGIFQTQAEISESPFQNDGTRPGDIKFADLNEDGIIDDRDQTFIGSPHPDYAFNIGNDFNFKGFDLNIFIQSVQGNEILNLIRRDIEGMAGLVNQSVIVTDRFRNSEPSTTIPRATNTDPNFNRRISDRFIEDGSFVRLRNITLGYTLPRAVGQKIRLQNVRFYASAQNLVTWTNYSGYDPDVGSYNQSPLINGVENGRYPIPRSYTFGLNATF
ncbi:MAG: SusC/RagA family TonB-linked outer membrane protein, partial [Bacteroidota bacterium]